MMRRELERRLRDVEAACFEVPAAELWIIQKDGMLRGPRGEVMTEDEFEAIPPRASTIIILPDNGRDPPQTHS
jgi:hypothetical protein